MPKKMNVVNLSHIKDAEESHNETNNDEQQLNEIKEEIAKEEEQGDYGDKIKTLRMKRQME